MHACVTLVVLVRVCVILDRKPPPATLSHIFGIECVAFALQPPSLIFQTKPRYLIFQFERILRRCASDSVKNKTRRCKVSFELFSTKWHYWKKLASSLVSRLPLFPFIVKLPITLRFTSACLAALPEKLTLPLCSKRKNLLVRKTNYM